MHLLFQNKLVILRTKLRKYIKIMKNILKTASKALCAGLLSMCFTPLFSQTPSTEGKAFWLSFMQNESDSKVTLNINVSAKRACQLTVENPNTGFSKRYNLQAGLNEIEEAATPLSECYNNNSEVVNNRALYITSTDTISLFASNYQQSVFDNAAILPEPALRDEYIVQTYPNSDKKSSYPPEFVIVAAENNTVVDITPTYNTAGGKQAGSTFNITLQRGQSYQVQAAGSSVGSDLSGSKIKARDGKKIAVFNGNRSEAIPYGDGDDGDHLFEQAMPVAYWGSEFVLTRTMNQLSAVFRITAKNNNTVLTLNGADIATLRSGETYQYELTSPNEVAYLETSCPAGVYMYMTSGHKFPGAFDGKKMGGPSSVWVSPIEQMIKEVNFATDDRRCKYHYVNIVVLSAYANSVVLTGKNNGRQTLNFVPVPGYDDYSFTKVEIPHDSYNLTSARGVIAYVYGLGQTEGYAYSAGSSVKVTNGITINGEHFSPDDTNINRFKSCFGEELHFSSSMKDVDYIEWDLADGVTYQGDGFDYTYDAPGVYDVECLIHRFSNPCDGSSMETTVKVRLEVNVPKEYTRYTYECAVPEDGNMWRPQEIREYTEEYGCDSIVHKIAATNFTAEVEEEITAEDEYTMDGQTFTSSTTVDKTYPRQFTGCDSLVHYNIKIVTCLHMEMTAPEHGLCTDEQTSFLVPFHVSRGEYSRWEVSFNHDARAAGFRNNMVSETTGALQVELPQGLKPGSGYSMHVKFYDMYECSDREFDIPFTVNYPVSTTFTQKWDDVLALYNDKHNGGYTFYGYQWYKNGEPVHGATGSYYYAKKFEPSGVLEGCSVYSVLLTDEKGKQLMSCDYQVTCDEQPADEPQIDVDPTLAEENEMLRVRATDDAVLTIYNTVGMPIETVRVKAGENTITAPATQGTFLLKAVFSNGRTHTGRLLVK